MFKSLSIYYQKNILKIGLYGFMCGMSLLLSGNTINFWLASYGVDAKIIGLFSFIVVPYVFKFLIAMFMSQYNLPWLGNKLGHYKAWLFLAQLFLSVILVVTSFLNPKQDLYLIAISGFLVDFFAVMQDIILNYNRIKILDLSIQPVGSAMYTIGYRLGMLFSGAGVIFSSVYISWSSIYLVLASVYIVLTIVILCFYTENDKFEQEPSNVSNSNKWQNTFIQPFQDFLDSKNFIWIVLFILLYKVSDHMLAIMLNPFLLQMSYSAAEIASISKFFGIIMAIMGGIISGPIITKFKIRNSLIAFSVIHIGGNLLFIILSTGGKNIPLLYLITAYEALTAGMMMTAYLTFISGLCKGKHMATQYALLSSGMGLSRALLPSVSGVVVDGYGWVVFFIMIAFVSVITTVFTCLIPKRLFVN